MTKCDFCTKYDPKEGCFYVWGQAKQEECIEAIQKMIKALKGINLNETLDR